MSKRKLKLVQIGYMEKSIGTRYDYKIMLDDETVTILESVKSEDHAWDLIKDQLRRIR